MSSPARTVPPDRRNMSMIFQSYALWPHMTVADNVAYGLELRKVGRETIERKRDSILGTTHLVRSPTVIPASSPAASSSGWRWRAP